MPLEEDDQQALQSGTSNKGVPIYSNAFEEEEHKPIPVVQFGDYINRVKTANYARLTKEYRVRKLFNFSKLRGNKNTLLKILKKNNFLQTYKWTINNRRYLIYIPLFYRFLKYLILYFLFE